MIWYITVTSKFTFKIISRALNKLQIYFRNKYEEPTATEGFSEIVHVSFVPSFKSEEHKKLYSMFLCEK